MFFGKLTDKGLPSWEEVSDSVDTCLDPPIFLATWLYHLSFSVEKYSFPQWIRTQGGSAKFGSLLIRLRNVLSDRVSAKKMQKFAEELFEETILRGLLRQYLGHVQCSWQSFAMMKKELGLVCWTEHMLSVIEKAKDKAMLLQLVEAFLIRWDSYIQRNVPQGSANTGLRPAREKIVAGLCGTKVKFVQNDCNDWHKEYNAGAIDYNNPCRSEHLIEAKQAQVFHWINAIMTYEM